MMRRRKCSNADIDIISPEKVTCHPLNERISRVLFSTSEVRAAEWDWFDTRSPARSGGKENAVGERERERDDATR